MEHFPSLAENQDVQPKPHPKKNKLQKGLGKDHFDNKHKNDENEVSKSQMVMKVVPDTLFDEMDAMDLDDEDLIAGMLLEDSDDEEILNTVEETEVEVAFDSGCVKHCFGKEDLPRLVRERIRPPPPNTKDFIGAGGRVDPDSPGRV